MNIIYRIVGIIIQFTLAIICFVNGCQASEEVKIGWWCAGSGWGLAACYHWMYAAASLEVARLSGEEG
jgi:hypothetical protein